MKIETRNKVVWVLSGLLLGFGLYLAVTGGCESWSVVFYMGTLVIQEIIEHGTGCCIRQCCDSPGCCAECCSRVLVNPILIGFPVATLLILLSFNKSLKGECQPVGLPPSIWFGILLYFDSIFRGISVCIRADIYDRQTIVPDQQNQQQQPQMQQQHQQQLSPNQQQMRQDRPPSMLLAPMVGQPHQLRPVSPHNPYGQPQPHPVHMQMGVPMHQQQPPQPAGYPPSGPAPYAGSGAAPIPFGGPGQAFAQPAPPPDEGKPAPMAFGGGSDGLAHSPQQVSVEIDVDAVIAVQQSTKMGDIDDIDLAEEESISISLAGPDDGLGPKRSVASSASGAGGRLGALGRVVSAKDVIDGDYVLNEKVTAGGPGELEEISWNSDFEGFARRASSGFIAAYKAIDPELQCVMCLCEFEAGEILAQLNCGHFYHKECIMEWFDDGNHLCPYCRGDVRNFRKARWNDD